MALRIMLRNYQGLAASDRPKRREQPHGTSHQIDGELAESGLPAHAVRGLRLVRG
jgi:hypothetical protein